MYCPLSGAIPGGRRGAGTIHLALTGRGLDAGLASRSPYASSCWR